MQTGTSGLFSWLAEPGKAHAVYIGPKNPREALKRPAQERKVTLGLEIPAGTYCSEWINTLTGETDKRETHRHEGGKLKLESPAYRDDVALKLTRR